MLTNSSPAAGPSLAPPAVPPLTAVVRWLGARVAFEDPDAQGLVAHAPDPDALVAALVAQGRPPDAVKVVARALPKREAIWWAFVAARHAQPAPAPAVQRALASVEQWIAAPGDASRHAAFEAAQAAGADTPIGCVGMAVFLSGGSLAPPGAPVHVPPPAGACWQLVAAAVSLAAVRAPAPQIPQAYQTYLAQGVEIVHRLGGWEASATLARQAFEYDVQLAEQAKAPPAPTPTA